MKRSLLNINEVIRRKVFAFIGVSNLPKSSKKFIYPVSGSQVDIQEIIVVNIVMPLTEVIKNG